MRPTLSEGLFAQEVIDVLSVHVTSDRPIERPAYAWLAMALQLFTALTAVRRTGQLTLR